VKVLLLTLFVSTKCIDPWGLEFVVSNTTKIYGKIVFVGF